MMRKLFIGLLVLFAIRLHAQNIVTEKKQAGSFVVVSAQQTTTILFDEKDDSLVRIAAGLLANDIEMVSGEKPGLSSSPAAAKNLIIIGSISKSGFLQQLVKEKKLNVAKLQNKWEAYQIQIIKA